MRRTRVPATTDGRTDGHRRIHSPPRPADPVAAAFASVMRYWAELRASFTHTQVYNNNIIYLLLRTRII